MPSANSGTSGALHVEWVTRGTAAGLGLFRVKSARLPPVDGMARALRGAVADGGGMGVVAEG